MKATVMPFLHDLSPTSLLGERQRLLTTWRTYLGNFLPMPQIDHRIVNDLCEGLLDAVTEAQGTSPAVLTDGLRGLLSALSVEFAERGLAPSQTATFIFSLKHVLNEAFSGGSGAMEDIHKLIDTMGLYSMDAFISRREQIIRRQNQELVDLSVPVVPLWEGVLSLPIIGTLDSSRAQAITEKLLFEIARSGSRYAILDISGVPTVDTQTAQHLAKTVAAARLMGAECVITGIRPAIAQVMVSLGINLSSIETRFSLAEGLRYCFGKLNYTVVKGG
ncbi:rsbT co-antagonist protein RsbR [Azospirillum fermentarium]|uniref:STAS domain-containing protein n=1 Tax=Azospirillum fermentarium TaxID=1233114 RepID=UPI0022262924|nr:STAS domain-containing protein [Azospirillum fermentarium]MCW2248639.1 rsbT co-antagonist protein RsbR [Azospirillum fermentarium]